jgi:N-acetylneuraminate synthase
MKKVFIIAEIGINHNGDISIAKKLIDLAASSGCDSVKFQKRDINLVYDKSEMDTPRESPWGTTFGEQKKGLEFNEKDYIEIDNYCREKNIEWFASAWDLNSLEFMNRFNTKYNKVASAMIVDVNFLKEVAKQKKYTFISTGMASEQDISAAVKIFKESGTKFELMHCVSTYPMKVEDANLATINALKDKYNVNVGYSGHESGLAVSFAAMKYDITSLERHITLDRAMYGSDQSASLEKAGLENLVKTIRKMEIAFGQNKLGHITKDEEKIAKKLRKHIKRI